MKLGNWYHASAHPVSRGKGKSAVGAAAYVTGQTLENREDGKYRSRNHPGDVAAWGTVAPPGAPAYLTDPKQLAEAWNNAQAADGRKNAQTARHWEFALRDGWKVDEKIAVTKAIAQSFTDNYGVMTTYAVHEPTAHGDSRNWHGHIVHNMRQVGPDGFGAKVRGPVAFATAKIELEWGRHMIEDRLNEQLAKSGCDFRVTCDSYKTLGIAKEPTKHLGSKQHQAELRGERSETGDENREIRARNEAEIISLTEARKDRIMAQSQPDPFEVRIAEGQADVEQMEAQRVEHRRFFAAIKDDHEDGRLTRRQRDQEDAERAEQGDDITSVRNRFLNLAGEYYDMMRPYGSLSMIVGMEGREAKIEHERLTKQMEAEADPDKRNFIEMRRDIQFAEYYAYTGHRLAEMSKVITGDRDSEQAQLREQDAREWRDMANYLREQRSALQERMAEPEYQAQRGEQEKPASREEVYDRDQEISDIKARWKNDYNVEVTDAKAEKIAASRREGEESEAGIEASRGRSAGNSR